MGLQKFWEWLEQGQLNVPTLADQTAIDAIANEDRLTITAGNGVEQPLMRKETVFQYVREYMDDTNQPIEGNKRYVIALFKYWMQ